MQIVCDAYTYSVFFIETHVFVPAKFREIHQSKLIRRTGIVNDLIVFSFTNYGMSNSQKSQRLPKNKFF